jgi:hypothetical protein
MGELVEDHGKNDVQNHLVSMFDSEWSQEVCT